MISNVYNALGSYHGRTYGTLSRVETGKNAVSTENTSPVQEVQGDSLHLSSPSVLEQTRRSELQLPFERNVQELSNELSASLAYFYRENAIEAEPAVDFSIDSDTGDVIIESNRPDAEHIVDAINHNDELKKLMQTVNAIAGHAYTIPAQLKTQQEYRPSVPPSDTVSQMQRFVGKDKQPDLTYRFDGHTVSVLADGQTWLTSVR